MKTSKQVDALMAKIPADSRHHWCEAAECACIGCVQIWNRAIMAEAVTGSPFCGDPEHVNEDGVPHDIWARLKISKEEWQCWADRNKVAS